MNPEPLTKDLIIREKMLNPSKMGFVAYADVLSAKEWALKWFMSQPKWKRGTIKRILNEAFGGKE